MRDAPVNQPSKSDQLPIMCSIQKQKGLIDGIFILYFFCMADLFSGLVHRLLCFVKFPHK